MDPFKVTLLNCADEPIHKIGHVQSCGVLLAWNLNTRKVEVASANAETTFGESAEKILKRPITDIFTPEDIQKMDDHIAAFPKFKEFQTEFTVQGQTLSFCLYRHEDFVVVEHELPRDIEPVTTNEALGIMHRLAKEAHEGPTIKGFAQTIAEEIRKFTGIDRVMVYRFHKDQHGEVIAEAKKTSLESYLGLHYPESDIPRQARELYMRNVTRLICDVNTEPVPLICVDKNIQYNFDLSDSIVRSVSPIHIQYLKNMGVRASMSVSILLNNKLWGLIACHHYSPLFVSLLQRSFCATLADNLAARVGQIEIQNNKDSRSFAAASVLDIVSTLTSHGMESITSQTITQVLRVKADTILEVTKSQGFMLHLEDLQFSCGVVPNAESIVKLQTLVSENSKESVILRENMDLRSDQNGGVLIPGVLAVKVPNSKGKNWISWFRQEHIETVRWGGKDEKSVVVDNGVPRLTPRGSFEEFTRTHQGMCEEFSEADINGATEFFGLITNLFLTYWNEAKKAVDALLATDKAKDTFIGIISHELRTPLNNILGWIQILDAQIEHHSPLREGFQVIKENAANQVQIVNDLLDVSRMITGKFQLQLKYISLSETVSSVVKSLAPMATASNVEVTVTGLETPSPLYADDDRIRQVVRNVIQNALKFTPKKGRIHVSLTAANSNIVLEVQDSGIGIAPEKLPNIFNKFYQADSKSSRVYQGLGLGLAICKSIVEMSGGRISIHSEGLGKGTSVRVTLPVASVKDAPLSPSTTKAHFQDQGNLEGIKILLLEDQIDSVRFMTMAMSMAGAEVTAVYHAREALDLLKTKYTFDIIISDIGLPEIDGYEFIRLAKSQTGKLPPMIALTAHGRAEDVQRSVTAGYTSHVTKPVQLKELFETVRAIVGKNAP